MLCLCFTVIKYVCLIKHVNLVYLIVISVSGILTAICSLTAL